jgi:hypothetical protein
MIFEPERNNFKYYVKNIKVIFFVWVNYRGDKPSRVIWTREGGNG